MTESRRLPVAALVGSLVLLALCASGNGVTNQFTYDDRYIIQLNSSVHQLDHWWRLFTSSYWPPSWGGDGYRPLTMLFFAIEWVVGGGSPMIYHALNIALYAAAGVLVFTLASLVLPVGWAWLAAALFAVHPVHVEAVANVVGQAELWVAVAALGVVGLYLRDRRRGALRGRTAIAIVALFAFACLTKEHAIMIPALIVAAELILVADPRPLRVRFVEARPLALALVAVALGFLGARSAVLASVGFAGFRPFVPFQALRIGNTDRVLTMFGVVPEWIRLFLWPRHLSSEYAPPEIEIAQGVSIAQLPGFLILCGILGLAIALWRRRPAIAFGIAWICIALLPSSNFLVPAGIILAERTLFLPSVGAMIAVAGAAQWALERWPWRAPRVVLAPAAAAALLAGIVHSARRTTVWHDNDRLFNQAIVDAPLAYRAHYMLGAWEFEHKRKRIGEREYRQALSLFPYDPFLSYNLAEQYRAVGMCEPAVPLYRWTQALDPRFRVSHSELAWCLLNLGDYRGARTAALRGMERGGIVRYLRTIIAVANRELAKEAEKKSASAPRKTHESVQKTTRRGASGGSDHLSKPM
jgi:hypothetical protein